MPISFTHQQPTEQETRVNLALLLLALYVEAISRTDPATFLQEQMTLWRQGSYMWLHELFESDQTYGFDQVAPECQNAHQIATPEQIVQIQAVLSCILTNPLPEIE